MSSFPPPPNPGFVDAVPALQALEGLVQLHPSEAVVVTRPDGVVLWVNGALEDAVGNTVRCGDLPIAALFDLYLEAANDTPLSLGAARLARESTEILRRLGHGESVSHYPIEAISLDGHRTGLKISAFGVNRWVPGSQQFDPPNTAHLYVFMLRLARPAAKLSTRGQARDKARDRAREEPNAFFDRFLDQLPEATLSIDQSGIIKHANERVVSLLGKSRDELIDTPISLFFPSSAIRSIEPTDGCEREAIERNVAELTLAGQPTIFVEIASRKIDLPGCSKAGHLVQLRDTTCQQRLTERFKQKIASLESYVHTVSHDLRSPLVSLLGFTRLLKQDYGKTLDETGRRFLDRIEQAGTNMNAMTQDLLDLSIREGPNTNQKAVDPRNILLQIQAELKSRLDANGVRLVLPSSPAMVQCDRTQLYQIFSNLIGNAIQHMGPCEGAQIKIEIHTSADRQLIVVRDNGRGIAADAHERIFDAFHSLSREDGLRSSGVGLAIVKKIALAHRGRVWVESKPGQGAAFFVSLEYKTP